MIPAPVDRLVDQLARLPGVGRRTATRFAFHIIDQDDDYPRDLAAALVAAADDVGPCPRCGFLTEVHPCALCADPKRDDAMLCVVEGTPEVVAIEGTGAYRGRYHTLGGVLSPLEGIGPERLRVQGLVERGDRGGVEVGVGATQPSGDGYATAHFLAGLLKARGVEVTRIASGLPIGASLEHADHMTLARALEGRRPME